MWIPDSFTKKLAWFSDGSKSSMHSLPQTTSSHVTIRPRRSESECSPQPPQGNTSWWIWGDYRHFPPAMLGGEGSNDWCITTISQWHHLKCMYYSVPLYIFVWFCQHHLQVELQSFPLCDHVCRVWCQVTLQTWAPHGISTYWWWLVELPGHKTHTSHINRLVIIVDWLVELPGHKTHTSHINRLVIIVDWLVELSGHKTHTSHINRLVIIVDWFVELSGHKTLTWHINRLVMPVIKQQ